MLKTIFVFLVSVIGLPIYAACVVILLGLGAIFGWSYVDASVYVCEYVQPWITALLALVLSIGAIKKITNYFRTKSKLSVMTLVGLCIIYVCTIIFCITEFFSRISTYKGMDNHQIFVYVVNKLNLIGVSYPAGGFRLFNGESISYGYIMANMEVYILPISILLLCGFIQWRISKRDRFKKP